MFQTVWSYKAVPYLDGLNWRIVFFYVASLDYWGNWMGPSDCVWIIPRHNEWECD